MGSSNASMSWIPPPLSSLNIHDCAAAAPWAAAFIKPGNEAKSVLNVPIHLTTSYLRSMIPQNWTSQPSALDLIIWSFGLWDHATNSAADPEYDSWFDKAIKFPFSNCRQDICEQLDWQGDPDVSGIGMMISYYVALALATFYFIVLAATRIGIIKPTASESRQDSTATAKIIESFQESVNTFLDASLIFAASMLGAALVRYASVLRDPTERYSAYEMLGSVFMSAFSIFPALMLQAVADGPRAHFVRHLLWFVVISFAVAVEVLYRRGYSSPKRLNEPGSAPLAPQALSFEGAQWGLCEDEKIRRGIELSLTAGHFVLGLSLLWWLYYLVLAAVPSRWKALWGSRSRQCKVSWDWRTSFRIANGALCFAVACCLISLFHWYRHSIHELTKRSDKDSDWQFGQVLALATWVPVGVDFCAIFCYGPERGMSGKLSSHYRVVPNENIGGKEETCQMEGIYDNSHTSPSMSS